MQVACARRHCGGTLARKCSLTGSGFRECLRFAASSEAALVNIHAGHLHARLCDDHQDVLLLLSRCAAPIVAIRIFSSRDVHVGCKRTPALKRFEVARCALLQHTT